VDKFSDPADEANAALQGTFSAAQHGNITTIAQWDIVKTWLT
jgi:hypothetical protein